MERSKVLIILNVAILIGTQLVHCRVTYDSKAISINGVQKILFSGSIHYPRSTPEMWDDLIVKAKKAGLDVIDTYVFWNVHEPYPGNYTFEGRYDIVRFIKTVQKHGLYVSLRIGPYIDAEWNLGGIPVWLKFVPGVSFRRYDEPFTGAMQAFTSKIVQMMKDESLFQPQGGPIIFSQIENEFGSARSEVGVLGIEYIKWAPQMALKLDTRVPWIMCLQSDATDPVINTYNGFYSFGFSPNKPYKPKMWSEAWSGWFQNFGGTFRERPVEDLAYAVANFTLSGGSYINYYMFHGGTNFGRTSSVMVTTSYDYDAPVDEYGLPREPKYSHLKELHKAVKRCESALLSSDPELISLGNQQQAHVFSKARGTCSAFLQNLDTKNKVRVLFNNMTYELPPWSISILPDCKNEVFNTAKVRVQAPEIQMLKTNSHFHSWEYYNEDIPSLEDNSAFTAVGLLEQINVTKYETDYLWYMNNIDIRPTETFLQGGKSPMITIRSKGHSVRVFVNEKLAGSGHSGASYNDFKLVQSLDLQSGINKIALLSATNGLYAGAFGGGLFEKFPLGITAKLTIDSLDQGELDLSGQRWTYKVGLKGEAMHLFSPNGVSSVKWTKWHPENQVYRPLIWYKAYFDAPHGKKPLALDMKSMQKGQVWINGESIGRYWTVAANGTCTPCDYAGVYVNAKCQLGCGQPSQRWYHVPREWLKPKGNLLVLFEEVGGDVSQISLVKRRRKRTKTTLG